MNLPLGCSKRKYRSSSGFTIVELIVVVVIIGVLATILIYAYTGYTQKAKSASLQSDLSDASTALKLFQLHNDNFPTTISTDCNASPDSTTPPTNKCLKFSNGNTVNFYQADNTTNSKTFFLNATSSDGKLSYRITDTTRPLISSTTNTSCLAILNAGDSTGDGVYLIKPSATAYTAYCDMANGGWTKLNNNIATATTAFNSSDILITNNVPDLSGGCSNPGCAFTINNISVSHTNVKVLLTRTTSVVQCANLAGGGVTATYWNGSSWIGNTMCTWGDGVFANAYPSTNMTGLKMLWKLEGPKAGNGEIKFTSTCSGNDDMGQIQVTAWVK